MKKRVLVACEYSGTVRDAFADLGFDAWSADILPTEKPGNHYKGNVLDILNDNWDLLIAHPPCQYISSAGLHWLNYERHGEKSVNRLKELVNAVEFFMKLYNSPAKKICIENPVGFISSTMLKPSQIIHPYFFGERELKRTALWLKGLPTLEYKLKPDLFGNQTATEYPTPYYIDKSGKARFFTDSKAGINKAKERAKTFNSIANAMAAQWSHLI